MHQLIKSIEEAYFEEASRVDDPDHINQILSDIETIASLAENDSKLSSELDLTDTKYLAWQKLDYVYERSDEDLTQAADEAHEIGILQQKVQEHQIQVDYVDSLFTSLNAELSFN